ncbi:MAG TPA: RNA methyltransferase [Opitutaceae bacterium]|jgi:TrmH RNA methyltransferase|nr:RNA methyltransferase [Opitutaceae bacterium]HRE09002.1 RNA methyltransferase [Opitutaceae bacterium]
MNRNELVMCGLPSVRARFERDPASVLRLFFDEETARKVGPLCKALAAARKVYRCVPPAELEAVSGTVHHGGIVAVVTAPVLRAPVAGDVARWVAARAPLLVLDRIGNAHNLGAIARTAAFFGIAHLVIPVSPEAALPSEAAYRVSEGGLEHVTIWRVGRLGAWLKELRASGYEVIGAATRGGRPDALRASSAPLALVLGNEETGMAPDVAAACNRLVTLPGTGKVESLNVSVASAVLIWEIFGRQAAK